MSAIVAVFTAVASLSTLASASSFISRAHEHNHLEAKGLRGGRSDVAINGAFKKAILQEIEDLLGAEHRQGTEARLRHIEENLNSTYVSMEKNSRGNLDHASVRFVLHRYFLQLHAWSVQGLASGGDAWSAASPADVLQGRVDDLVQGLFEKRLGARGLDLHELSVLAATIENLIHRETLEHFDRTRKSLYLETTELFGSSDVDRLLDTYMMGLIHGTFDFSGPSDVESRLARMPQSYGQWSETQKFVRDVREQVLGSAEASANYGDVVKVVEAVADRWGKFQDGECRDLKKTLGAMESRGPGGALTGRVPLSEFYGSAVRGDNYQFTESAAYLRKIGALDEIDPTHPQVITTNYIQSPSNCISASKFYTVCCLDECEQLMDHIEHSVAAPKATPEALLAIVAGLPSSTRSAGRTLAPSLEQRLREVSEMHGGQVPLHGRLFAQWMHHAYPRECRYPHLAGTIGDGRFESVSAIQATREEMHKVIDSAVSKEVTTEEVAPWHHEEELLADAPSRRGRGSLRSLALLALVASTGLSLYRMGTAHLGAGGKPKRGANCLKDHYL